jgi:hypothetical protein
MPKEITALLADVQRLVREVSEMNANDKANQVKEESQPAATEKSTLESATSPASDFVSKDESREGLVIGVDHSNQMKLERIEVTPEPDGRLRIMVSAKKEQR